jgi:hypothetical protein
VAVPLLAAFLAGCGGGVYFGIGGSSDNRPPSVTLTTAAQSVGAGQTVRYVAAAADESGIDQVALYRQDSAGDVLLGTDTNAPYEWTIVAPTDGRSTLSVFARATDNNGNQADSAIVTINVTP